MKPLEELLEQYRPLLRSLLYKPFWKSDSRVKWSQIEREEMEMFLEDCFIHLYYEYDPSYGVDFEGYMVIKLRKKAHHYAKKLLDRRYFEQCYPDDFLEKQDPLLHTIDDTLDKYLHLLTARQADVLRLWYESHLTPKDIADTLNIPRQNVYTHLRNAQKKIKQYLEEKGE